MSFKVNTSVPSEELASAPAVMDIPRPKPGQTSLPATTEVPVLKAKLKQSTVSEGSTSLALEGITEAAVIPEEAKAEEQSLSPHFAQLAKRERIMRRQLEELKREKDAFKSKEQDYQTRYVPRDQISEDFRSNPLEAMQKYNLSYDQLTQAALNAPSPQDQTIAELKKEIAALRGGVDETKQLLSKQQTQAYDQALSQIRTEAKQLVFNDPQFETIKEMKAEESVVELIKETFDRSGTIMSVEEAAKEVEEYLLDETLRLMKMKKIQERLNATAAPVVDGNALPANTSAKTLTHASLSSGSKGLSNYERAMLAFKGELK